MFLEKRICFRESPLPKSVIFTERDQLDAEEKLCSPQEVAQDRRLENLLRSDFRKDAPLLAQLLNGDLDGNYQGIQKAGAVFIHALKRWNLSVARIEKIVSLQQYKDKPEPFDRAPLATVVSDTAQAMYTKLLQLRYEFPEEIDGIQANISNRFTASVSVVGAPVATDETAQHIGNGGLTTLAKLDNLPFEQAIYSEGSTRSDIAVCTNQEKLWGNLEVTEFPPDKYEIITVTVAERPVRLVYPKGAQEIVGLMDLFKEVGGIVSSGEVAKNTDMFVIGAPDEVFEGVTGAVQNKEGKMTEVPGAYKRFHFLDATGRNIFVVGNGEDMNNNILSYFGVYKKAVFQSISQRMGVEANTLLGQAGYDITDPEYGPFKYSEEDKEKGGIKGVFNKLKLALQGKDQRIEKVKEKINTPFHGTLFSFIPKEITGDNDVREAIQQNHLSHNTLFEGQSGMGKSEMQEYLKSIFEKLGTLADILEAKIKSENGSTAPELKEAYQHIQAIQKWRLLSNGDDMGSLSFNALTKLLEAISFEMARFNRLDNQPNQGKIIARPTIPVNKEGEPKATTNTRVIQKDPELANTHDAPMPVRNAVLATNLLPEGLGLDSTKAVQEVDFETYMKVYYEYQNQPNGTKDTLDPVKSTAAGHEFFGQGTVQGGVNSENLAISRRFMFEEGMKVRKEKGMLPMKFFVINTGINPTWINDGIEGAEKSKRAFANAARHFCEVSELLPDEIRKAIGYTEKVLGINIGQLAFHTDGWKEEEVIEHLERLIERPTDKPSEKDRSVMEQNDKILNEDDQERLDFTTFSKKLLIEGMSQWEHRDLYDLAYKIYCRWNPHGEEIEKNPEQIKKALLFAKEIMRREKSEKNTALKSPLSEDEETKRRVQEIRKLGITFGDDLEHTFGNISAHIIGFESGNAVMRLTINETSQILEFSANSKELAEEKVKNAAVFLGRIDSMETWSFEKKYNAIQEYFHD
ncbi:MAG: hypothetical protein WCJ84_06565 [Candidatus Peregrinibacteria bacterium]